MRYQYTALTGNGQTVSGWLEMPDAASVVAHLQLQGLLPIDAMESSNERQSSSARRFASGRKLSSKDLILITRQLARLTDAGLPLDRSLVIIAGLLRTRRSRNLVEAVHAAICDGSSLSEAIEADGGAFPTVVLAMVRAGEQGGVLAPVLGRTADFLERAEAVRQSTLSALIYPAILAAVAGLAITIVLTVVLPEFEPLFQEAGSRLPLVTQVVMVVGHIAGRTWWLFPPLALVGTLIFRRVVVRPQARWRLSRLALRTPLISPLVMRQDGARYARSLSVLLANGVAPERALGLASAVVQNAVIAFELKRATEKLRRGEGLSGPLLATGKLPNILIQLVRVGEETGKLSDLLAEAANLLEAETQQQVDRLLALLVPALTVGMGIVIATIVASVLLAMLSINDLAS